MAKKEILVYVIEDDESVRRAFGILMQSAGFHVQVFSSADEFLEGETLNDDSCIILDMRMPGVSGLDLLRKLASRQSKSHVIVVSAYDDAQTREIAAELGAIAFFRKPVDDQALIDTILWAMAEKKKEAERLRPVINQ
jgi:FixJ family two-component response regulator